MIMRATLLLAIIAGSTCLSPALAAERKLKAETRAIIIGAGDIETAAKEFKTDLNGPTDFVLRDKAWERLTIECAGGLPSRFGAQTTIFSIDGLIGFFAEKIVKFFRKRAEAALDAALKKYAHSYEAPVALLVDSEQPPRGEQREPATLSRSFGLYRTAKAGDNSPELAVRCFRVTKSERFIAEGEDNNTPQQDGEKKLVSDFIGVIEISPENPFELQIRPLRLIYVKPTAQTSMKSTKHRDGTTTRERPINVAVNLAMGGAWREDNRVEQNSKFFEVIALNEKFSLEELERNGYVERWYDNPKASKKKPGVATLPPSSKIGDDYFAANAARATVAITESGYEPRYLKTLKKFFDKYGDDAEKEGVKRVKDALGELIED